MGASFQKLKRGTAEKGKGIIYCCLDFRIRSCLFADSIEFENDNSQRLFNILQTLNLAREFNLVSYAKIPDLILALIARFGVGELLDRTHSASHSAMTSNSNC